MKRKDKHVPIEYDLDDFEYDDREVLLEPLYSEDENGERVQWMPDLLERASRRARLRNRDLSRGLYVRHKRYYEEDDGDDYPTPRAG